MIEFRKKQKRLKKIMNIAVIFSAVYLFVYIGISPMLKALPTVEKAVTYISYILVIASMILLYIYYSKYGKTDKVLESVENELSDVGYYFTSRQEKEISDYKNAVISDLRNNGFSVDENVVIDDLEFDAVAYTKKELVYIVANDEIDKNDLIAYIESAIYDITSVKLKRKANAVMLYLCDYADSGAVSLSKMITPLGRKEEIKVANSIVELSTRRCYFLGNNPTKCQQMIANYAMNCDVPIKKEYIGKEKLPFQKELEDHMKDFNLKDFKSGNFYIH